jgi:hypothetical protein
LRAAPSLRSDYRLVDDDLVPKATLKRFNTSKPSEKLNKPLVETAAANERQSLKDKHRLTNMTRTIDPDMTNFDANETKAADSDEIFTADDDNFDEMA